VKRSPSDAGSRSRWRWLLGLGLLAGASVLALALWWWQGSAASNQLKEQHLARALSQRWGLPVEVQGLELQPGAAGATRARIGKLAVRDPERGFAVQLERVAVQAQGRSLETLRIESLRAERGRLALELDAAGQPRLPPAFSRKNATAPLPQLEVQALDLDLAAAGFGLHATALSLRNGAASGAAQAAAGRVELRGARAELEGRGRRAELKAIELSVDEAFGTPRLGAQLQTVLAGEPARGQLTIADGRVSVEMDLAGRVLRAPGSEAELGQLAGRAQLSAELGRWEWAGQAQGTLRAAALAGADELPWSAAVHVAGDQLVLDGALHLAGAKWQLSASFTEAGTPLRAELRAPRVTLGELALEGVVLGYHDDGSASGPRARLKASRLRWQGLEARTPSAELRPTWQGATPSWSGRIALPELRLDAYLASATGAADLRGRAVASVELAQVTSRDPKDWVATLTLSTLVLTQSSVELSATEPLIAELSAGRLRVRPTRLTAPDSELTLAGEGALSAGAALTLTGQTRLARLTQVYASVQEAEGVVEHDLRLAGPWTGPRLGGALLIREARLRCFGEVFEAATASLRLEDGALHVERAAARVRDGRVEVGGRIALDGLRIGALAVQVRAGDFAIEPLPEARAKLRLDARVEADGPGAVPRVSGTLSVLRGAYRHPLPLQALPALLGRGLGAGAAGSGGPARFALDLALAFEPPIRIRNNLADATLSVDSGRGLRLIGTDAEPRLRGRLQLDGRLLFQSNEFQLDQAGFEFLPDTGLWPRTELSAATARGVRLQLSGPPSDLSLSVRCDSASDAQRPFECRLRGADAQCDRFEELVARFQCAPGRTGVD